MAELAGGQKGPKMDRRDRQYEVMWRDSAWREVKGNIPAAAGESDLTVMELRSLQGKHEQNRGRESHRKTISMGLETADIRRNCQRRKPQGK